MKGEKWCASGGTRVVAIMTMVFLFFFQAEDGIRDSPVTGVQTCALPIYRDEKDQIRNWEGVHRSNRSSAVVIIPRLFPSGSDRKSVV